MARHRDIASSPVRTAAETWTIISELITVTLDRSSAIDGNDVRRALDSAGPAGTALVAAGYTNSDDVTVVADPLRLTIRTVSGAEAFKAEIEENLNPVPGAATAVDWMVYLPKTDGLAPLIEDVVTASDHLSAGAPPAESKKATDVATSTIDLRRLDPSRRS